jgi:hypothetical protein
LRFELSEELLVSEPLALPPAPPLLSELQLVLALWLLSPEDSSIPITVLLLRIPADVKENASVKIKNNIKKR